MLEDLVSGAFNDARSRADRVTREEMERIQAAGGIPPGFKLPRMWLKSSPNFAREGGPSQGWWRGPPR